nr:MAG TPA: hypothetical protein [Caudoviricetes sp.]
MFLDNCIIRLKDESIAETALGRSAGNGLPAPMRQAERVRRRN